MNVKEYSNAIKGGHMKKIYSYIKIITSIIIFVSLMYTQCDIVYANSAEPPSVVVLVPGASKDIEVFIKYREELIAGERMSSITETKFIFYDGISTSSRDVKFYVEIGADSFEISTPIEKNEYHLVYTIDVKNRTVSSGMTTGRKIFLVFARVGSTLIIEAYVFMLYGFKNKRSWMMFLAINLITQTAINIKISLTLESFFNSYYFLNYIVPEFYVFITEICMFNVLVKEKNFKRRTIYVLAANFTSLFFGGLLLAYLI